LEDRTKLIESAAFSAEGGTSVLVAEVRKDTFTGAKFHGCCNEKLRSELEIQKEQNGREEPGQSSSRVHFEAFATALAVFDTGTPCGAGADPPNAALAPAFEISMLPLK
jgi:hypothetical protein